jgi:hypothetical protein
MSLVTNLHNKFNFSNLFYKKIKELSIAGIKRKEVLNFIIPVPLILKPQINICVPEIMNKTNCFSSFYPLPNLPPRGKECHLKLFPLGGNGKGGYWINQFIN